MVNPFSDICLWAQSTTGTQEIEVGTPLPPVLFNLPTTFQGCDILGGPIRCEQEVNGKGRPKKNLLKLLGGINSPVRDMINQGFWHASCRGEPVDVDFKPPIRSTIEIEQKLHPEWGLDWFLVDRFPVAVRDGLIWVDMWEDPELGQKRYDRLRYKDWCTKIDKTIKDLEKRLNTLTGRLSRPEFQRDNPEQWEQEDEEARDLAREWMLYCSARAEMLDFYLTYLNSWCERVSLEASKP